MEVTQVKPHLIKTSIGIVAKVATITVVVYAFFVSIELMARAFGLLGKEVVDHILVATSNPFIGLLIGLLSTAILQSSSVITAATVAIVASGTLSIHSAIPIIMGANIGTTVTSTLVALSFLENKKEFRKAIACATVHSFFNIITVAILFPLELFTSFLSQIAIRITSLFYNFTYLGIHGKPFFEAFIKPVSFLIIDFLANNTFIIIPLSLIMLLFSIKAITYLLKHDYAEEKLKKLDRFFFKNKYKALLTGMVLTAIVQSSSLITSLAVPLVATNKVYLRRIFPFIMGANIGTTVTALFAALSISELAVSIALVHVLFNLIGTLLHFFTPLQQIPVWLSRRLGSATVKSRLFGFAYILCLFFIVPFLLIYFSR